MSPLNDLNLQELTDQLAPFDLTEDARITGGRRLFGVIHARGEQDRLGAVHGLRRSITQQLADRTIARLGIVERRRAPDGFAKYLFEAPDGALIEAVRIPIFDTKYLVCVSSQVGCALGCAFCDTGKLGFTRNLETWEMVEQVRAIRDEADHPVRGVVFMGMGEPLLNDERVLKAARILSTPGGIEISGRAITLSTAGIVPAIRRYTRAGHPFRLTFSVTSAIPEKRHLLMPIEKTYPLEELVESIREYTEVRRERAMIGYVAIGGVNMGLEDAEALEHAFRGIPIKIDLIDVHDASGRYRTPTDEERARFRDALQILKAPIARRYSGGKEIGASCGNLARQRSGGVLF